jgi:hypothetical protein
VVDLSENTASPAERLEVYVARSFFADLFYIDKEEEHGGRGGGSRQERTVT